MRLTRYRVTNFRSVADSDWIDADGVTALIGVNESGKTNLLAPLWKLNPAREGEIKGTVDFPKSMFGTIRAAPGKFCFITAEFESGAYAGLLGSAAGISSDGAKIVRVKRYFDGRYEVSFPEHTQQLEASPDEIRDIISGAGDEIAAMNCLKQEDAQHALLVSGLRSLASSIYEGPPLPATGLDDVIDRVRNLIPDQVAKTSSIFPRAEAAILTVQSVRTRITALPPGEIQAVKSQILKHLPKFVYYSNYGNLDSEIYLPHVVENLRRDDLGDKESAKARTLRVLFKFVQLEPEEILELGEDFIDPTNQGREPTQPQIAEIAEKKRERSILLQSAGSTLTKRFKEWWKQGDYRFRFEADGDHFRIWVADDRRPDEVELESRSTGLQWFLSFYLVFLVESEGQHENSILLLDEPGLSLHPLAQYDLSAFFDNLSNTNQLLYTTHSPFLVRADRLDRARKVYMAEDGTTKATSDLRQGSDPKQAGAAYAVHSALGLSVADSLLLGCQPVIVEGSSDQHYLTAIKTLLISSGKLQPQREIVFPPAGGSKNTKMVASILTGRDETLPFMILDGDIMGQSAMRDLVSNLYQDAKERLILVDKFTEIPGSEVEDLIPISIVATALDKWLRNAEIEFGDVVKPGAPVVAQIEAWAAQQNLALPTGWKVELSKRVKQLLLTKSATSIDQSCLDRWAKLFAAFNAPGQ